MASVVVAYDDNDEVEVDPSLLSDNEHLALSLSQSLFDKHQIKARPLLIFSQLQKIHEESLTIYLPIRVIVFMTLHEAGRRQ